MATLEKSSSQKNINSIKEVLLLKVLLKREGEGEGVEGTREMEGGSVWGRKCVCVCVSTVIVRMCVYV